MDGIRGRLSESVGAFRGVFANPGLRRVELAFAGSAIGNYAFALSVAVYAFHHGGATAVGVVSAVRYSVAGVIAPFAATLSDRFPRRRVMLASDLGRLGSAAAIAVTAAAGGPRLAGLRPRGRVLGLRHRLQAGGGVSSTGARDVP